MKQNLSITIARKAGTFFKHTEKLFSIRNSSEYETSDKDRKVNRNI